MACPQGSSGQDILVLQNPTLCPGPWMGAGEPGLDKSSCVCRENGAWGGYRNEVSVSRAQG